MTLLKPGFQWAVYLTSKEGSLIENLPVIKIFIMVISHVESLVSVNTVGFTAQLHEFFDVSLCS